MGQVEDNNIDTGVRQGKDPWRLPHSAMSALRKERSFRQRDVSPRHLSTRLPRLMVQSVYSDREILVRELLLKPSRPGWLRPPSHPTRRLRPARLGWEPSRGR